MSYRLSLLDKSPIPESGSAEEALATTLAYADLAERHGYHRFWAAEHHGARVLASAAPEIVISWILARTKRIRVGSGAVLLQHYSPYKVAELFGVLGTLAPGRVDLGIGRAPGGLPFGTRALQAELGPDRLPYAEKLAEIDLFLKGVAPEGHPLAGAEITPRPAILPERFLLGASEESARLAASLGWGFVYGGHHNGEEEAIERSLAAYGNKGPRPILTVVAFAARSREEARLKTDGHVFKAYFSKDRSVNLGSIEQVAEYARQLGEEPLKVEEHCAQVLAGTPDDVHEGLERLARRFGIEEFILDSPVAERAARLDSIELIATARRRAAA
jgi:luciferase family oxidoreductase group 1